MADKSIFQLTTQSTFADEDRLVIGNFANNDARAITGRQMVAQLTALADGHGGIQSIAKTSSSGSNPVVDTYTITYADTTTSTFTVTNGVKGNTGAQTYVYFRWAHECTGAPPVPANWAATTSDPDDWIGVVSTTSSSAPTNVNSYKWYKYKGETGATGTAATVSVAPTYQYAYSATQTTPSTWYNSVSDAATAYGDVQGSYLYTKTVYGFNDGTNVTQYSVAYQGANGTGTGTVKAASYNGTVYNSVDNVGTLALSNIQAQHLTIPNGITIAVSDWNNNTCTKTATGVTSNNSVIVSPAPSSFTAYASSQIRATAQATNQLTFTCTSTPSEAVTVNILIMN